MSEIQEGASAPVAAVSGSNLSYPGEITYDEAVRLNWLLHVPVSASSVEARQPENQNLGDGQKPVVVEVCKGCGHTKGHHGYFAQLPCQIRSCDCNGFVSEGAS